MGRKIVMLAPHSQSTQDVIKALDSSLGGLTTAQATQRLKEYGSNSLPTASKVSIFSIIIHQFLDPLIYILLFAAILSAIVGAVADTIFIFVVLVVNAAIGSIQEHSAQRSAASLQRMVTRTTKAQRDGETEVLAAELLVPGDIVWLESGDKVPADMRLLQTQDTLIDESLLSGESMPVSKEAERTLDETCLIADRINMAFSGTLVGRGRAMGMVTTTGLDTELGKIAADVLQHERVKPPLIQRMERFTFRLTIVMAAVISLLAVISLAQGMHWLDVTLLAVALAVAAIPEGLPVAMTVALAISIRRMASRHVIARRLVTVEALGSCTFIATDKTGTLTRNEISAQQIALPDEETFNLSKTTIIKKHQRESFLTELSTSQRRLLNQFAECMVLANEGILAKRDNQWIMQGDSVDTAVLVMAHNLGIKRSDALVVKPMQSMLPFESGSRYIATRHTFDSKTQVCVKGAVETILEMCSSMACVDGDKELNHNAILEQAHTLAAQGYRVLAAAQKIQPDHSTKQLHESDLTELTFLGLVGMIDPLREESKQAVAQCQQAGIRVAMLTGDHPLTAFAIGKQLGFVENLEQVKTAADIAKVEHNPEVYDAMLNDTRVYARLEPHQKLNIVTALQNQGHFVAVTGDGANDAPALQAAHVGVAMGTSGTDVARETADIILVDDNFASIVAGVEEGRIAYSNVRKVVFLLLSTGAGEIVLFMLSILAGLPLPLTAVQLLWLNLVTNGIQDVALAFEPGEGNELNKPPREPNEPIFNRLMIERVLVSAVVIGVVAFTVFNSLLLQGMNEEQARNGTLLLMVIFENIHVFNSRSETRSVFTHNPLRNPILLFGTLAAQALHIAAMYTPGLRDVLQLTPVSFHQWFNTLLPALSLLVAAELYKWMRSKKKL